MTMMRNTATPAAQIHQCVYHTSDVVDVVTLPLVVVVAGSFEGGFWLCARTQPAVSARDTSDADAARTHCLIL